MISELRKYRINDLAIFDLVFGLLGVTVLMLVLWKIHYPKLNPVNFIIASVLLLLPLSIFTHVLFGINTTLNNKLGLSYSV